MLAQPHALPCAQQELAPPHRHAQRAANERRFDVRRAIVGPLGIVAVQALAPVVLRCKLVESIADIRPHVAVPGLVDGDGRAGVLQEQIGHAHLEVLQLRHGLEDIIRDLRSHTARVAVGNECVNLARGRVRWSGSISNAAQLQALQLTTWQPRFFAGMRTTRCTHAITKSGAGTECALVSRLKAAMVNRVGAGRAATVPRPPKL